MLVAMVRFPCFVPARSWASSGASLSRRVSRADARNPHSQMTDTVLIVGMNIVATNSSNLIDPNDPTPLDSDNISERRFGSKMVLVVEQMQCVTIWLVKTCLLIMYYRLT